MSNKIVLAVVVVAVVISLFFCCLAGGFAGAVKIGVVDIDFADVLTEASTGEPTEEATEESSTFVSPLWTEPIEASAEATEMAGCVEVWEAKKLTGVDLQKIGTEECGFVWRGVPEASESAVCPFGWICTMHLFSGRIEVFVGDGQVREIVAGTFRKGKADACEILKKEQVFGATQEPSFLVFPGNITCPAE